MLTPKGTMNSEQRIGMHCFDGKDCYTEDFWKFSNSFSFRSGSPLLLAVKGLEVWISSMYLVDTTL